MVIRYNDILTVITTVGDDEQIRVAVKESVKGGLIAGTSCAVGGLLLGPMGLAVGGAVGGAAAAYMAQNAFRPVSTVIMHEMREEQRDQLVAAVRNVLNDADGMDAAEILALVQGSNALKARIASELFTFFARQMNMNVQGMNRS